MRSVLIGTVEGTDSALRALQAAGHPPALVGTFAPEIGRQRHVDYVDIAALCGPETDVAFIETSGDLAFIARVREVDPDCIFVIGWSQIVGPELIATARRFAIGFHPTPLPRLRGRAAIAWTILSGATEAGISLFVLDQGVDTGPLLQQQLFPVSPRETAETLIVKNKQAMADALDMLLPKLVNGTAQAVPQAVHGVSYGARRTAADAAIDWTQSAEEIDRLVRAQGAPYSGAFTFTRQRRVTIWSAEPVNVADTYFASPGQIVFYDEGRPVVLCGAHTFLRLDRYTAEGKPADFRFTGQPRFRDAIEGEGR